jgi:hypothetical protein
MTIRRRIEALERQSGPQSDNPLLNGTHTVEVIIQMGGKGDGSAVWITDVATNERFKAHGKWLDWWKHYSRHQVIDGVVVEMPRKLEIAFTPMDEQPEAGDA